MDFRVQDTMVGGIAINNAEMVHEFEINDVSVIIS